MIRTVLFGAAAAVIAMQSFAADVRLAVPGGGALVLPAPAGWKEDHPRAAVPTVALSAPTGNTFQMLVSALVRADGATAPADADSLRKLVGMGAQAALSQATESSLPLQELRGDGVQGSYFSATDRAPKPGEFKYMIQGAASVQGLPVTFTILSNGDPHAAVEPALRMLRAARRER